jgi:hypothetical protein
MKWHKATAARTPVNGLANRRWGARVHADMNVSFTTGCSAPAAILAEAH